MFDRALGQFLQKSLPQFRGLYVHGPRQSGKTTLCRKCFPDLPYVSLENPDVRMRAEGDPRGFLSEFSRGAVLDEIQKVPALLSYLQQILDEGKAQFVLTGSQNLLLMEGLSQTLAGRIAVFTLAPLSRCEMERHSAPEIEKLRFFGTDPKQSTASVWKAAFTGGFPGPVLHPDSRATWMESYVATYLERDVRDLLKVHDLILFQRFLSLCAVRSGQLLNIAQLSSDSGLSESQCRRWLSVLQASEILWLLPPWHRNLGKRVIKSPKLYLADSGLLCHLLGIRSAEDIPRHPLMGAVFETYVVNELRKSVLNRGERPREFFWRDKTGREIDWLLDAGSSVTALECKAGETLSADHFRNLDSFCALRGKEETQAGLFYGGSQEYTRKGVQVIPWWKL